MSKTEGQRETGANRSGRVVDARGHRCPTPSLLLRLALAEAAVQSLKSGVPVKV